MNKALSTVRAQGASQRSELLSRLSHDLRTPLAAMQGYLELLLLRHNSMEPAEAHNYLQTAVRQCERLARLVSDLFELAHLEADGAVAQTEAFALAELAQDLVQKFSLEAQRRGVALAVSCNSGAAAAQAVQVRADIALIEKLLDKLVDNALRHTPAGGAVTIEIAGDEQHVRLAVCDNGEGIAAEDLPGLFKRFERGTRTGDSASGQHAALGLTIAQRIAELHGSQLHVQSAPGVGTTVSLDLALAGAQLPDVSSAAAAPHPPQPDALARTEALLAAAQAELRATEERYQLALRGSQDGLWEWELASGAVQLSPRWKGMLGFESHELGNDKAGWRARIHRDDLAAFDAALARHLDGADPRFDHEMRLLHKDGSVRHVLSRGVAIRDDHGAPYRMLGHDTDVTRLRRVQAVLDAVADGTTGAFGEAFFAALVQQFARALEVDCAFIAECLDDPPTRVRTLAYWSKAKGRVDNFEFALAGTPCDEVLNEAKACFHRERLAEMFPREAAYEAYLGMPIIASDGRVLGHLALFSKRPLGDEVLVDRVYRIFIARAAAEMERMRALARLVP